MSEPSPSSTFFPELADSPLPPKSQTLWPTPNESDYTSKKTSQSWKDKGAVNFTLANGDLMAELCAINQSPTPKSNHSPAPPITTTFPIASALEASKTLHAIQSLSDAVNSRLSSLVDFLASRTASPESGKPLPTSGICGVSASESLGSYAPDSRCLKTSAACLQANGDFFTTAYCQTWPRFGLLVSGRLYPLPKLAHRTAAKESGFSALTNWPTASSRDYKDTPGMSQTGINPDGSERQRTDQLARAMYASGLPSQATGPAAPDNRNLDGNRQELWATPRTITGGPESAERKQELGRTNSGGGDLQSQAAGKLNPQWVSCLMGYPPLWAELGRKFKIATRNSKATETPSSHKSPPYS